VPEGLKLTCADLMELRINIFESWRRGVVGEVVECMNWPIVQVLFLSPRLPSLGIALSFGIARNNFSSLSDDEITTSDDSMFIYT
jgi:hypothetical protein